ncbi:MAG: FAD-binding protein [Myxococcales bacterium]|nr:FAD-binding protein [Myxococcales bacterium]MCB9643320.1 FAD-binding protein [Myxococcales bacterium]
MSTQAVAVHRAFTTLKKRFEGEVRVDEASRMLYSTDASIYQVEPDGVVLPKHTQDIIQAVKVADLYKVPIIPRAAGTSLAGQCVGKGMVLDVSKYMNRVLETNAEEGWMWVEPGVIQDDINALVAPYGLQYGPDTSTSNRAMIGGMIGNNSCGTHSILYGKTVDHLFETEVILSDGSIAHFKDLTPQELEEKKKLDNLEGHIYREITRILSEHRALIKERYPKILRRNTGYLLDELLREDKPFNLSRLLCASEGTLALITRARVNLVPLPKHKGLVVLQANSLRECMVATVEALPFQPAAIELIDKTILDLSKGNISLEPLRFFLEGDPQGVLAVEFYGDSKEEILDKMDRMEARMKEKDLGYTYPRLWGADIGKVWNLRKAGLGIIFTMPGDSKPVAFVEDTAVPPDALPDYIEDFQQLMEEYGTSCVYYAHASVGELHMRPVLNLKDPADVEKMKQIAEKVTELVIKYGGSISGEHGDGRVRAPFNERFFGTELYNVLREVKRIFDPKGIFNPNKIVDAFPMDQDLRYPEHYPTHDIPTALSFEKQHGYVRATEFCNGAGACRKSAIASGTMCPSYQATLEEQHSTRGRANVLRTAIMKHGPVEAFKRPEVHDTMKLCLECKACKSECPSNVDMAKLKYEYLQRRHDVHGIPLSDLAFGWMPFLTMLATPFAVFFNLFVGSGFGRWLFEQLLGVDSRRKIPEIQLPTLRMWFRFHKPHKNAGKNGKTVHFLADPFINYNDPHVGIAAITVLEAAGYNVELSKVRDDGRTLISKGFTRRAKKLAEDNIWRLRGPMEKGIPLVGVEPSTLLTIRDEYRDFFPEDPVVEKIAQHAFLIDEFLVAESTKAHFIHPFAPTPKTYLVHGHCFQKSLVGIKPTLEMLRLLPDAAAKEIPSGCCGMAGSFGYDKEKYDVSMKIGELKLFPAVRDRQDAEVVAVGTSCRHQILDGTAYKAKHPIEILYQALR